MTQPSRPTDEQFSAYIGPKKWDAFYRRKFERFGPAPEARFRISWNWTAALFPLWFVYNRLYASFAALTACVVAVALLASRITTVSQAVGLYLVAGPLALLWLPINAAPAPGLAMVCLSAGAFALIVLQGSVADWLLYRKALVAAGRRSRSSGGAKAIIIALWILGLPALGCGCDTGDRRDLRDTANGTAMKFRLRELASAEEDWFAAHGAYTTDQSVLAGDSAAPRKPDSITVTIGTATRDGWSATATRKGTTKTCGIFVGSATAPMAGLVEAEPKCP
jgi:hypothetical protein